MNGHLTNRHETRHLSQDQLLDRLYGLGEADGEANQHLRMCSRCTDRLRAFERRRAEAAASSDESNEPSSDFLAAQRRGIYARLEEPSWTAHGTPARWAPALAAGFALAACVYFYYPEHHGRSQSPIRPAPAVHIEMSDEQLFSDVYSMEQSAEPRAAVPIHALFEDGGEEKQ